MLGINCMSMFISIMGVCLANVMESFGDVLVTDQQTNRCKNTTASGGGKKIQQALAPLNSSQNGESYWSQDMLTDMRTYQCLHYNSDKLIRFSI